MNAYYGIGTHPVTKKTLCFLVLANHYKDALERTMYRHPHIEELNLSKQEHPGVFALSNTIGDLP